MREKKCTEAERKSLKERDEDLRDKERENEGAKEREVERRQSINDTPCT